MNTITRERDPSFYPDSRKRLEAITTDAAALASFDAMVECIAAGDYEADDDEARRGRADDALSACLGDMFRLNISLDHVFLNKGEPFLSPEVAA